MTSTKADGSYELESVPAGSFVIEAAIDTNDRASISGLAVAGATLTGRDLLIEVVRTAIVSGRVQFPDGTATAGASSRSATGAEDGVPRLCLYDDQALPRVFAGLDAHGDPELNLHGRTFCCSSRNPDASVRSRRRSYGKSRHRQAEKPVIRDPAGRMRAELGPIGDAGAALMLYDGAQRERIVMSVLSTGRPVVAFHDDQGIPR